MLTLRLLGPVLVALVFFLTSVPGGAQATLAKEGEPLRVTGLESSGPLSLSARATPTRLIIEVDLDDGWHLYGRDTGGGRPVEVDISDGSDFVAAGTLDVPMNDNGEITGRARLSLPLRGSKDSGTVKARMRFMVCDALQCLAPTEVIIEGGIPAGRTASLRVLLVVMARDDRASRIEAFLKTRGFEPTVTTLDAVTTEACDAHDVVLADSPYFSEARKGTRPARVFPEAASPLVAVGFLGTVLLEAQKVAMACGYI
jgi:hypothetical protein